MAKIKNGGKTESLNREKYINEVSVYHESQNNRAISMMINGDSLSYLTLEEALVLRDELNDAIKKATGLF